MGGYLAHLIFPYLMLEDQMFVKPDKLRLVTYRAYQLSPKTVIKMKNISTLNVYFENDRDLNYLEAAEQTIFKMHLLVNCEKIWGCKKV